MTIPRSFLTCIALSSAMTAAFAAGPAANPAPPASAPVTKAAATNAPAATPPAPAPAPAGLTLDDYIKDLTAQLNLTDSEKRQIERFYVADGGQVKDILNNDAISPLQQAQQVAAIRDTRNTRIEALLDGLDRQRDFLRIEAKYRVALTELAADGGLVAAPPPAPPAPAAK